MATLLLALVACAPFEAIPVPSPSASPTSVPSSAPASLVAAAQVARAFAAAIDTRDFARAYALLTPESQAQLGNPETLRRAYQEVQQVTQAQLVDAQLVGSVVAREADIAEAQLVTHWESQIVGAFVMTGTLRLHFMPLESTWRVAWTRDAIEQGLSEGYLALELEQPERGALFAADGTPLAVNRSVEIVGVQPSRIRNADEEQAVLSLLARMTGLDTETIRRRYVGQPADWFIPIAEVPAEVVDAFAEAWQRTPAVQVRARSERAYPNPTLAPHVVGFVGPIPAERLQAYRARGYVGNEVVGLAGIEAALETVLRGSLGGSLKRYNNRGGGRVLARREAQAGVDLTLTISPTLQRRAQQLLNNRPGAVIVMRVEDGAVLAMASAPTFTIGDLRPADVQRGALLNRAAQGQYPPGSTFKIVTLAAALEEGVAQPNTVFFDPGYWDGFGSQFRLFCWLRRGHGRITARDGLTASCNVVFYELGKQLNNRADDLLSRYARLFGFGQPTGIELEESPGLVPDPAWKQRVRGEPWLGGDAVNMAIGQGALLVSPLQVARMTAAIASGGVLVQPRLVYATPVQRIPLALRAETLRTLQEALLGVTTNARYGTALAAFRGFDYCEQAGQWVRCDDVPARERALARRLRVAGKTGTAQAGRDQKPFAWFTAYAPADQPEIVVTVALEEAGEGSAEAAPLARAVFAAYFGLAGER